jgi:hypothetical protein
VFVEAVAILATWCAMTGTNGMAVGCFCPRMVLHALRQEFGPDLECDGIDTLAGYGDRTARTAAELGIPLDSPVVRDAARVERELGQRVMFRLRGGEGVFATGRVDGGAVYQGEADFSASVRDRFVAFLGALPLGAVLSDGCDPEPNQALSMSR